MAIYVQKKAAYTTIQQHNTRNWIPAISCKRFGRTRLFAYLNKHKQQQQHTIDARRNKYTIQSNWWLKFLLHSLFLLCLLSHSLTLRQCIQNMCSCVNDGILFSFFFCSLLDLSISHNFYCSLESIMDNTLLELITHMFDWFLNIYSFNQTIWRIRITHHFTDKPTQCFKINLNFVKIYFPTEFSRASYLLGFPLKFDSP